MHTPDPPHAPPVPPRSPLASLAWGLCALVLGWAVASVLRHHLVEPAELTARCDAIVWAQVAWAVDAHIDLACGVRALTVQAFIQHRLAHVALALALLSVGMHVWRRGRRAGRWLAGVALCLGAAALVLYSADRGALAVLLAGWAWVAAPAPSAPRNGPPH